MGPGRMDVVRYEADQNWMGAWQTRSGVQVSMCRDVWNGYGELTQSNEAQAHRWDIVDFLRAQLIIEAQHLLFSFLRDVIVDLLRDVEIESSSTKWLELSLSELPPVPANMRHGPHSAIKL